MKYLLSCSLFRINKICISSSFLSSSFFLFSDVFAVEYTTTTHHITTSDRITSMCISVYEGSRMSSFVYLFVLNKFTCIWSVLYFVGLGEACAHIYKGEEAHTSQTKKEWRKSWKLAKICWQTTHSQSSDNNQVRCWKYLYRDLRQWVVHKQTNRPNRRGTHKNRIICWSGTCTPHAHRQCTALAWWSCD